MSASEQLSRATFASSLLKAGRAELPPEGALRKELERRGLPILAGATAAAASVKIASSGAAVAKSALPVLVTSILKISAVALVTVAIGVGAYRAYQASASDGEDSRSAQNHAKEDAQTNTAPVRSAPLPTPSPSSPSPVAPLSPSVPIGSIIVPAKSINPENKAAAAPSDNVQQDAGGIANVTAPSESAAVVVSDGEAALIARARSFSARSPAVALDLLDEYDARYPSGALGDDAVVIRVQALLATGRRQDAEEVARRYMVARYLNPHSDPNIESRLADALKH